MKLNGIGCGAALGAVLTAGAASAVTVDPADFDSVFTEGLRTATTSGEAAVGSEAVPGNGDIDTFDIPGLAGDTLLVGRVEDATDTYTSGSVTGFATITVLNYAQAVRDGISPFSAVFSVFAGSTEVGSGTFGSAGPTSGVVAASQFNGDPFRLVVDGQSGAADYDVSISIASVPLPAAGLMLIGALGGLGMMRRRK
ncbi:MAG: VPLPA-CTERM sorting domain-containing protein [Pseudomonadota bacterium]